MERGMVGCRSIVSEKSNFRLLVSRTGFISVERGNRASDVSETLPLYHHTRWVISTTPCRPTSIRHDAPYGDNGDKDHSDEGEE